MTTEAQRKTHEKKVADEAAKAGIHIDTDDESGQSDKDSVTGEPVKTAGTWTLPKEDWEKYLKNEAERLRKEGKFDQACRLEGKEYNPEFGEWAKHTAVKMKNATVTVLLAAVTPLFIVALWEGIRLVIPKARSLPGLIKYKPKLEDVSKKVVRLSAR